MYIVTSERGQPLYNGQNDPSQCVHYLEVPLYMFSVLGLSLRVNQITSAASVAQSLQRTGRFGVKLQLRQLLTGYMGMLCYRVVRKCMPEIRFKVYAYNVS